MRIKIKDIQGNEFEHDIIDPETDIYIENNRGIFENGVYTKDDGENYYFSNVDELKEYVLENFDADEIFG